MKNVSTKIESEWGILNKNKTLKKGVVKKSSVENIDGNHLKCEVYSFKNEKYFVVDANQQLNKISWFNYDGELFESDSGVYKSKTRALENSNASSVDFTGIIGNSKLLSDFATMFYSMLNNRSFKNAKLPLVMYNIEKLKRGVSYGVIPSEVTVVSCVDGDLVIDFQKISSNKPYLFATITKPFMISSDRPVIQTSVVNGIRIYFTCYMISSDSVKKLKENGVIEIV